jgi:bifunctional non-homologous end joining protein LigD
MSAVTGKPVPPMLATLGQPPTGERWAFESKWDGQRSITTTGSESPALWSRNGNNISASFPEIVDALRSVLDHRETVLDGEIVALGPDGVPSFSLLQRRMHVLRPTTQLRNEAVTSYYVFDVLDIDGASTTDLPCQWPRSSPRRRPVVLPAGGHGFSPVAASCFSPPAF